MTLRRASLGHAARCFCPRTQFLIRSWILNDCEVVTAIDAQVLMTVLLEAVTIAIANMPMSKKYASLSLTLPCSGAAS